MFRPTRITPPAELPVTRELCKQHAVVDFVDDDEIIDAYIAAAVDYLDGFAGLLGRCMVTQTWQVEHPAWCGSFVLPVPDVSAVSVVYDDADGAEQSGPVVSLHPVAAGTLVRFPSDYSFPTLESGNVAPVRVQFTAGFGGADDVPFALKVAIMQKVDALNENRSGDTSGKIADLISLYRWSRV